MPMIELGSKHVHGDICFAMPHVTTVLVPIFQTLYIYLSVNLIFILEAMSVTSLNVDPVQLL